MIFGLNTFIDIHTHILPGLDDGPRDMTGSIAIARCYEQVGIKIVVATPHFLPGTAWAPTKERVLQSVRALQASLDHECIDLNVVPGMEIAYHKKLEERILMGSVLPLGESGYFLIEPSFQGEQEGLLTCLQSLLKQGQKLILAHPERADMFQQMPTMLRKFVDQGLCIQVNAGSLLGYFGEKSRATAELLRQAHCIHFIASDAHDHSKRGPLDAAQWKNLLACPGGGKLFSSCNAHTGKIFKIDTK
jgi:protein-tyrosine phosphatase